MANASREETDGAARVIALAVQVFGNVNKADLWLQAADDRLAGQTPLSMLETESGGKLVESLLWSIDEGVYS